MASNPLPRINVELVSRAELDTSPAPPSIDTITPSTSDADDESMSTDLSIPLDVIAMIGSNLARSDQAACLRVSRLFFETLGPMLWDHIRLSDIRTTRSIRSSLANTLLSLIRTLEIDRKHHPTVCQGIGEGCTALNQIVFDTTSKLNGHLLCTQKVCGSIPVGRNLRLVIHNSHYPCPAAPQGLLVRDVDRNTPSPRFSHLTTYFSIPETYKSWLPPIAGNSALPSLVGTLRPSTLSLVFKPLTSSTMARLFESWLWPLPPFHIDPIWWDDPTNAPTTGNVGWDFCSALAYTCVEAPKHCRILIANIDQMPFHTELSQHTTRIWDIPPGTEFIVRSIKGKATIIGQARGGGKVDLKKQQDAEEELQERMEKIPALIKRWMQTLLEELDKGNELEERWGRIKFVSLYEYKDLEREKLRNSQTQRYW